jgi:hypothetical protein
VEVDSHYISLLKLSFLSFTVPYDNVYGFEQNLRIENAVSPPHTTLSNCVGAVWQKMVF